MTTPAMDNETLASMKQWLSILEVLWLAGLSVVLWLRKPGLEAQQSVKSLQDVMNSQTATLTKTMTDQNHALDKRITTVEETLKHMPTTEQLANLRAEVRATSVGLQANTEALVAVRESVSRIEHYLLSAK